MDTNVQLGGAGVEPGTQPHIGRAVPPPTQLPPVPTTPMCSIPPYDPCFFSRHGLDRPLSPGQGSQPWHHKVVGLENQLANLNNNVLPMWWNQVGGWQDAATRRFEELETALQRGKKEMEGMKGVLEGGPIRRIGMTSRNWQPP